MSKALLEDFGRERLSQNFFMRDFLYSETATKGGLVNIPPTKAARVRALDNGRQLCEQLLEPLQHRFGRLNIRSAYRSKEVNDYCNAQGNWGCAASVKNFGRHIWDEESEDLGAGAMCCVVIPVIADIFANDKSIWRELAWWIHDTLPYSELEFFARLCTFNIGWAERPAKRISNYVEVERLLTAPGLPGFEGHHEALYQRVATLARP